MILIVTGLCGAWIACDLYSGNLSSSEVVVVLPIFTPFQYIFICDDDEH